MLQRLFAGAFDGGQWNSGAMPRFMVFYDIQS
jgi:hypothetical protein